MKARYYDPEVGRFYSNDQVGFSTDNPFSFNRYAYANNNPYKFVDLDGKSPLLIFMAVAALTSYLNSPGIGDQPISGMTPEAAVALGFIPVERAGSLLMKSIWTEKSAVTLTRSQQKYFNKIDEIQHNVDVRKSLTGDNLDDGHIIKLTNHRIGLNKSINGLKNSLKNPNLDSATKTAINNKITQAQNMVNRIDELLEY